MCEIYVYREGARIGLVQNVLDVRWTERYQAPGDVFLTAAATEENLALLVIGNRLHCTRGQTAMRIAEVEMSGKGADTRITVRGWCGAAMLADRIVMATVNIKLAEAGMYAVLSKNLRKLPLTLATAKGYLAEADTQQCWVSVLDAEVVLAESSGLGFRVGFNPLSAEETFEVFNGTNRCSGGAYNGYFGDDAGNVLAVRVERSAAGFKNVAAVAGCEEEGGREVVWVSPTKASGEARRELFVDGKSLRRKYQLATDTGAVDAQNNPVYTYAQDTYSETEYQGKLRALGLEKLAEATEKLSAQVDVTEGMMRYGEDYALGDIVPVKLRAFGLEFSARVAAVSFVRGAGGEATVVTLRDFTAN